jgi:PAS domain S-box-containing protein
MPRVIRRIFLVNTTSTSPSSDSHQEGRFRLLLDSVHDYAIYMLSPEGVIETWNTGGMHIKGYTAEEAIGKHFSLFYPPEAASAGEPQRALHIAATEGRHETEGWRLRKDGSRFWAHVVIDPMRDPSGTLIGFVKTTRDITERRQTLDALRESEQHFRLLVQGVTDYAIYMLSPDGKISSWNAGAERIKGYTADEVLGTHFSRFYTEDDIGDGIPARALATASREGHFEQEGWRLRKDGSRFWAHVVIDPLYDTSGELIGFAKITRDITERKEASEALEQTRERLVQSQRMEAIGQLTGGIAHDFNNLLTVIVNSLDLIARKLREPADIRFLQSAQRAAGRGAELTQQLLAFARRQPLRPDLYNVNALIGGFEAILRRACQELVSFELILAPHVPTVRLDARQFEVALLNLAINARDAMPNGGKLVITTDDIMLTERDRIGALAPGPYARVTVRDSGSGMSPDVVQRAFEPFFTTKEFGKGTGLGLSQVYGFVTQSGGDVVIDSEIGEGTAVVIYLPAVEEKVRAGDAEQPASDQPTAIAGKVLVVEDEPDVLHVSTEIFRSMGYEVLTAENGMDAIDLLKRVRDVDVLFTDVVMPKGMSGIDLARFTRKLCPGIKVILVSGYPLPALTAEHGALDEFSFISKPFRWTELLEKIRLAREASDRTHE